MASTASFPVRTSRAVGVRTALACIRPLQWLMAAPALLFLVTLTAMLFRPPDLHFYAVDRIAFAALVFIVLLRVLITRQLVDMSRFVTLPLVALLLIALMDLLSGPSQTEDWSVFAAKWVVPIVFFQLSQLVFADRNSIKKLEVYLLVVLAYLSLTAIFFLFDARGLIFPSYILDENIGIHADRARGPFLQAVANGVTILLLGLVVLDSYRRGRLRGLCGLMVAVILPIAVMTTKTRSVWISFAGATLFLMFFSPSLRIRHACRWLALTGLLCTIGGLALLPREDALASRLADRSPVEFRLSLYRAGWEMFKEKPLFGWSSRTVQAELSRRMSDFHQNEFFFHNSYLEVAVKHGIVGLAFYFWVLWDLLRVGRRRTKLRSREIHFLDERFRPLWPVFVGVYLLNACFVVMNYQFVNGLLFTLAGVLAAQNRQWDMRPAIA